MFSERLEKGCKDSDFKLSNVFETITALRLSKKERINENRKLKELFPENFTLSQLYQLFIKEQSKDWGYLYSYFQALILKHSQNMSLFFQVILFQQYGVEKITNV